MNVRRLALMLGLSCLSMVHPAAAAIFGTDDREPLSRFAAERGWPQALVDQITENTGVVRCHSADRVAIGGPNDGKVIENYYVSSFGVIGFKGNLTSAAHTFMLHDPADPAVVIAGLEPPTWHSKLNGDVPECEMRLERTQRWSAIPDVSDGNFFLFGPTQVHPLMAGGDFVFAAAGLVDPAMSVQGVPFPLASAADVAAADTFYLVTPYSADLPGSSQAVEPYIQECHPVRGSGDPPQFTFATDCDASAGNSGGLLLVMDSGSRALAAAGILQASGGDNAHVPKANVDDGIYTRVVDLTSPLVVGAFVGFARRISMPVATVGDGTQRPQVPLAK
jgi:hypothetical protein